MQEKRQQRQGAGENMGRRPKISMIGAGMVGAQAAFMAAIRGLGDIVLVDIASGVPQGKALDLLEATPLLGHDIKIVGSNGYAATKDSDVVVITAGFPRGPGMSRSDLLEKNAKIVADVTRNVVRYSPHCILIVVTNPLDAMVHVAYKISKLKKNMVIGMAGVLDSSRFRLFVAQEAGVSVEDVHCYVLGGHGDSMVPLMRHSNIAGKPLTKILPKKKLASIVERTRKAGGEIVSLLKTGSAFYAPGAAIVEMVDSIVRDRKRILPCAAYLSGEYGTNGIFIGVPAKLGINGVEGILELSLDASERKAFKKTAQHVQKLVKETEEVLRKRR